MKIMAERWHLQFQAEVGPDWPAKTAEPNQSGGSNTTFTSYRSQP